MVAVRLVDNIPVREAAFPGVDLVRDVRGDSPAEGFGVVLERDDVTRHVEPRGPDEVVAADLNVARAQPVGGAKGVGAVGGGVPDRPFEVVFKHDAREGLFNDGTVAVPVGILPQQVLRCDGGTPGEGVAPHGHGDPGAGHGAARRVGNNDREVALSQLLDTCGSGSAPRRVGRLALVDDPRAREFRHVVRGAERVDFEIGDLDSLNLRAKVETGAGLAGLVGADGFKRQEILVPFTAEAEIEAERLVVGRPGFLKDHANAAAAGFVLGAERAGVEARPEHLAFLDVARGAELKLDGPGWVGAGGDFAAQGLGKGLALDRHAHQRPAGRGGGTAHCGNRVRRNDQNAAFRSRRGGGQNACACEPSEPGETEHHKHPWVEKCDKTTPHSIFQKL